MKRAMTEYPVGFQPNENNHATALKHGANLMECLEAFADYHQSKGNKFVNWNLALNTWIRNDAKFDRRKTERKPVSPILDVPSLKYERALDAYLARPPLRQQ